FRPVARSPTWANCFGRLGCPSKSARLDRDLLDFGQWPWLAYMELRRLGACAALVSVGLVALNALTGNRLDPSSASSVMTRPSSAANLPACPAPAQTRRRCDPGT